MKKQSGFTLIELMIVVAIIAILAAIALPAYQNYTKQARYSDIVTTADGLKTKFSACFALHGTIAACDTFTATELGTAPAATANYSTPAAPTVTGTTAITILVDGLAPVGQGCEITATITNGEPVWTYRNKNGATYTAQTGGCQYISQ